MHFVTFYIDGRKRTYGAEVFARTATDATLGVHHHVLALVGTRFVHHNLYSACRTSILTLAAIHLVLVHDTVLLNPHRMTDLSARFLFACNRFDSSGRTDIRALGTLWATIAVFVRHLGLHQCEQAGRWTQHVVWTHRHAKLTSRAMLFEVLDAQRTRRNEACLAFGHYLILDNGQTAVAFLVLCLQQRSRCQDGGSRQRTTATLIYYRCGLGLLCARAVADSPLVALLYTIHTSHTTAVVYLMILAVDARCLAITRTQSAGVALLGIDDRCQPREA